MSFLKAWGDKRLLYEAFHDVYKFDVKHFACPEAAEHGFDQDDVELVKATLCAVTGMEWRSLKMKLELLRWCLIASVTVPNSLRTYDSIHLVRIAKSAAITFCNGGLRLAFESSKAFSITYSW